MRLLYDQNLSRRLVVSLASEFPGSRHVIELGLDVATDQQLWEFARRDGSAIVSKDSDFRQLAFLHGPPPKVIWLRMGNVSTTAVADLLRAHRTRIIEFGATEEEALLVLPLMSAPDQD